MPYIYIFFFPLTGYCQIYVSVETLLQNPYIHTITDQHKGQEYEYDNDEMSVLLSSWEIHALQRHDNENAFDIAD